MHDFAYHRPARLDEALRLVRDREDGKLLAGGMSLLPTLKFRLAQYSDLVDLTGLHDLNFIRREADSLVVGAMTRHAHVAESSLVRRLIPALAVLAGGIGDPLVRNRGTIGGSLANADPAADYPAGVLGLGATLHTDRRDIRADDFFKGLFETALAPDEIITAIRFPFPERAGYAKLPNAASRFGVVGVFAAKTPHGVRVAVTGAAAAVFRLKPAEQALTADFSPEALDGVEVDPAGLNEDIHASAEYRARMIVVMAARAVASAQPSE